MPRALRLGQGRPHLAGEIGAHHVEQVQAWPARPVLEVRLRVAAELDDGELRVDGHARRGEAGEHGVVGLAHRREGCAAADASLARAPRVARCAASRSARPGSGRIRAADDPGELAEDLLLLVDGLEELGEAGDRLRAAQDEVAVLAQPVVETGDHPALQGGAEVDQQVAAADQVEVGERRVARHVVAREDAQLANGLVDLVAALGRA